MLGLPFFFFRFPFTPPVLFSPWIGRLLGTLGPPQCGRGTCQQARLRGCRGQCVWDWGGCAGDVPSCGSQLQRWIHRRRQGTEPGNPVAPRAPKFPHHLQTTLCSRKFESGGCGLRARSSGLRGVGTVPGGRAGGQGASCPGRGSPRVAAAGLGRVGAPALAWRLHMARRAVWRRHAGESAFGCSWVCKPVGVGFPAPGFSWGGDEGQEDTQRRRRVRGSRCPEGLLKCPQPPPRLRAGDNARGARRDAGAVAAARVGSLAPPPTDALRCRAPSVRAPAFVRTSYAQNDSEQRKASCSI